MRPDPIQQQTTRTAVTRDEALRAHMGRVYNRMTMGVMITAVVAWLVSNSETLLSLFLGGPQAYVVMFAPVVLVWFGFKPQTMSSDKLKLSFIGISVLYGISLSTIALAFTGEAIASAFFISTAMFAGLSIFGYTTKKDLSALGTFCMMGMIGLFCISILALFIGFSSQMHFLLNLGMVGVFAGITAWETQHTKEAFSRHYSDEANSRLAWSAALGLYISFIAIFINMLQIMNQR